jgi:hypothetical protein
MREVWYKVEVGRFSLVVILNAMLFIENLNKLLKIWEMFKCTKHVFCEKHGLVP